jgi:hypothetical protein
VIDTNGKGAQYRRNAAALGLEHSRPFRIIGNDVHVAIADAIL